MNFIEITVDASEFEEELSNVKNRFHLMVDTMKSIAVLIEMNTMKYVPEDTTDLVQSYQSHVVPNGDFIFLAVGYDAEDENDGFHYAEYQHNTTGLHHPKPTARPFYLKDGIMDSRGEIFSMIESDYMSLFIGGTITSSSIGNNTNAGFMKYLNMK